VGSTKIFYNKYINKMKYQALNVEELPNGTFARSIVIKNTDALPQNEVCINVLYSSLNYKDALSATGNKGITRKYPHIPGIDAAGVVAKSTSPKFKEGDQVICTGYDLGMNTDGGFGQYISVPADWVLPLPAGMSLKTAMIVGTAGFTAMNGACEIASHLHETTGNILVTGATGGVGTMAVAFLSAMGYNVVAASSKESQYPLLQKLGAKSCINTRNTLSEEQKKPLLPQEYSGCLDTVGGTILVNAIKHTSKYGIVATCGNIAAAEISISIFPFILRGVRLIGLASAEMPIEKKRIIWDEVAKYIDKINIAEFCKEITLRELSAEIDTMLQAQQIGRVVVDMKILTL
jgi:putative YhdH/YhfP family quinone oxidoreductase